MAGSSHPFVGTKLGAGGSDTVEQGGRTGFLGELFRLVLGASKVRLMSPDFGLEARGAQGAQEAEEAWRRGNGTA